jgi:hypothetical protein
MRAMGLLYVQITTAKKMAMLLVAQYMIKEIYLILVINMKYEKVFERVYICFNF